ncbi:Hypothetical_protein [Hexamita inflata]|uniref:Hypothetical_protein n=1 Tax=Hexamita inflata TaxID=28002 RepID=A0AA86QVJ2_9EUKA|nr:Hypothetical protein HINF_LOCUS48128 [Hexamita inflata]
MGTNFDQVDTALAGLKLDVVSANTSVNTLNSTMNIKFTNMTSLINDNQLNIKNNFTQALTQIADLKTVMGTNFDQVDTALAGLKLDVVSANTSVNTLNSTMNIKFTNMTSLINDNQLNIKNNFTQINLKIDSINTVLGDFKSVTLSNFSQISNHINTLNTKMNSQFTDVLAAITTCSQEASLNNQVSQLQTQIDLIKQQISSSQNTTKDVYYCLKLAAYYASYAYYINYGQNGYDYNIYSQLLGQGC